MGKHDSRSFESAWRQRFQEFAAARDDDAGIAGWSPSGLDARFRNFARRWQPRAGTRWLDAGCGAGTYARFLAGHEVEVVGVDYSLPSLAKARARSSEPIRWVAADATRLPFDRDEFDGAICFGVTQALETSAPLVDELARVVAPGGEIWIDALNAWCAPHVWERTRRRLAGRAKHTRYEFARQLRATFRRAGLREVRVHWLPIVPSAWSRYQSLVETRAASAALRVPAVGALLAHAFVVRGVKPLAGASR